MIKESFIFHTFKSPYIAIFIKIFRWCGFHTITTDLYWKNSIWIALNCILLTATSIYMTYNSEFIFNLSSEFRTFIDILQAFYPIGAYFIAIFETISKRDCIFGIWTIFTQTNAQLKAIGVMGHTMFLERKLKKYLIESTLINMIAIFVELKIICALDTSTGWFQHRISVLIPFNGTRMAIFHFLLYIHITRGYLQILATELQRIHHRIEFCPPTSATDQLLLMEIKVLKGIHRNLWKICYNINKSFSWTLLCIITMYFLILIVDLYWCFLKILVGSSYRVTGILPFYIIPVILS